MVENFGKNQGCERARAYLVESFERFLDALQAQVEFLLGDDKGRSEADAVHCASLCQYRLVGRSSSRGRAHMLTWVGLAKTPLLFMTSVKSHADRPLALLLWSITIAFNNPLPRTSEIQPPFGPTDCNARRPARIFSPRRAARADRSSLTMTSSAALATAHASGFCGGGTVQGSPVRVRQISASPEPQNETATGLTPP